MRPAIPIENKIVLLGAGNAHLQIVKWWGMGPIPGASLTLVSDSSSTVYSGMIPGYLAGQYDLEEISIDVSRLCAVSGVEFIRASANGIDPETKQLQIPKRPPIRYDVLSVNAGSRPAVPPAPMDPRRSLFLKPFGTLPERVRRIEERITSMKRSFHVAVVGSGAGGFEICLALHRRWGGSDNVTFEILTQGERVLSSTTSAVSRHGADVLREKGIAFRPHARVAGCDADTLILANGDRVAYDLCIWATAAKPLELLTHAGLVLDDRGFIRARDTLQSESSDNVFVAGDCASLASHPDLPKAGIFSVREGPVLWKNLQRYVGGDRLRAYKPQPIYLFLLNTADGSAIMNYSGIAGRGAWAWRWKNFIDRRWMKTFHDVYAEPMGQGQEEASVAMRCGGCGAKVGAETLRDVLRGLNIPHHDDILSGVAEGDDASVHHPPPDRMEVQSVDFFRPFVSDPYLFGEIAALNSLSDLYAMNAKPFCALAIVTLPYAAEQIRKEKLRQVLSGALSVFNTHGVTLAGGHTSEGMDFQIGFSVTGYARKSELFQNSNTRPGLELVLTKPLGSGALLRAHMLGQCTAAWFDELLEGLRISNRMAAQILETHGVTACTDITGFGLGGHLLELLDAADISARIRSADVPRYAGFDETASRRMDRIVSTLHEENARVRDRISCETPSHPEWLFDPQTSGGLLAAVDPGRTNAVVAALHDAGYQRAACIGVTIERIPAGNTAIQVV